MFNYDTDKNKSSRLFNIVCYTDKQLLHEFVQQFPNFAYIVHDKDVNDDGTQKAPHIHLLLQVSKPLHYATMVNKIEHLDGQNCRIMPVIDKYRDYNYLTHKFNPDKHLYNESDICCNDTDFWIGSSDGGLLDDILSGFTMRELARKYGRDFMKNYKSYFAFAEIVRSQEFRPDEFDEIIADHKLAHGDNEQLPLL